PISHSIMPTAWGLSCVSSSSGSTTGEASRFNRCETIYSFDAYCGAQVRPFFASDSTTGTICDLVEYPTISLLDTILESRGWLPIQIRTNQRVVRIPTTHALWSVQIVPAP